MTIDFTGKNVVITGGSAGIGYDTAVLFAKCGANVAICGRDKAKLDKAVSQLKEFNTKIIGCVCDAGKRNQMVKFGDEAEAALGYIDVWVNNAGYQPKKPVVDMEEEEWDNCMDANLKSVFLGASIASKKMTRGGVIINASSFATIIPGINCGAYSAAKGAVNILTKSLASELAPRNIRVNAYIPGVIDTDLNKENIKNNGPGMLEAISMNRFGTGQDVANGIVFLASDFASYITGTCLEISGGKFSTQTPQKAWSK